MNARPPTDELLVRQKAARALAAEAGALLLAMRGGPAGAGYAGGLDHKGAVDLVTEADRRSEALLVDGLRALFPDDRVIGEEGAAFGPPESPWTWVLDPLDGTTNFVAGLPNFAVSVAATWRGTPLIGVLDAPSLARHYFAASGQGAWVVASGEAPRPLRVSRAERLVDALAATGFPYDRRAHVDDLLGPVGRALTHCQGLRRLGSAALDLAGVAEGVFGVYWEPRLKPWDFMAGVVLVREAGGVVTDHAGGDELGPGNLAASNGLLHAALLRDVLGGDPA